jgi:hypothetical protein
MASNSSNTTDAAVGTGRITFEFAFRNRVFDHPSEREYIDAYVCRKSGVANHADTISLRKVWELVQRARTLGGHTSQL